MWPFQREPKPPTVTLSAQELLAIAQFSAGYQLAMAQGLPALVKTLKTQAIEEALQRLDGLITDRAKDAGCASPQPVLALQRKQQEFQQKLAQAKTPDEKAKYEHYLTALDWSLHANGVSAHED